MIDAKRRVIALYIRLSIEDARVESLSIENQRRALHEYADAMDVRDAEVVEFVDNGYSGTNFERPAFQTLLDEVREGNIYCILVKDSCVIIGQIRKIQKRWGFLAWSLLF